MKNKKAPYIIEMMFKNKRIACAAMTVIMLLSMLSGCIFDIDDLYIEDTADNAPYDHSSTYTLMVYLCGSDLESSWGLATADLREMIEGYNGNESVNIIVQTGGSYFWHNYSVKGDSCQRFKVTRNTIELIDDTLGDRPMNEGKTLSDFISYTAANYTVLFYGITAAVQQAASVMTKSTVKK